MPIVKPNTSGEEFDTLDERAGSGPVAAGEYTMEIFKATLVRNFQNTATMLNLGLKHAESSGIKGPSVWYQIGLAGANGNGDPYPGKAYDAFLHAVGVESADLGDSTGIDVIDLPEGMEAKDAPDATLLVNGDRVTMIGRTVKATLDQVQKKNGKTINVVQFALKRAE